MTDAQSQADGTQIVAADPVALPSVTTPTPATPAPHPDDDKYREFFRTEHLSKDLRGRVVRSGIVTLLGQAAKFFVQVGSTVALSRLLEPRDFGLVAMVMSATGFVTILRDMGLSQATVQRADITHGQVTNLFWINVAVGSAMTLVVAALAPILAWFYNEPKLLPITLAMATFSVLTALSVQHAALMQRQMQFKTLVIRDSVGQLVGFAAGAGSAWLGAGYWSLIIMTGVTQLTSTLTIWLGCKWRPSMPRWDVEVWSMVKFGGNLTGNNIVNYLGQNVDQVLIGYVYGPINLGLYSRSYNLLLMPMRQVLPPVTSVMMPALSRIAGEPERFRRVFLQAIAQVSMVSLPAVTFLIATSDWVIRVLLGPKWDDCVPIFAWLGLNALTQPINAVTITTWTARGRSDEMLRWGLIHNLMIIASIICSLPYGPVGVAASYAITGLLIRVPFFYWSVCRNNVFTLGDLTRATGPHYLISGVLFAGIWLLRQELGTIKPIYGLAITGAFAGVLWLAIMLLIPEQRAHLRDTIQKLKDRNKGKAKPA